MKSRIVQLRKTVLFSAFAVVGVALGTEEMHEGRTLEPFAAEAKGGTC